MGIHESLETILYFKKGYSEQDIKKYYRTSMLYRLLKEPEIFTCSGIYYVKYLFNLTNTEAGYFINGGIYNDEE